MRVVSVHAPSICKCINGEVSRLLSSHMYKYIQAYAEYVLLMHGLVHASTSLLRSRSQFVHLLDKFRGLCNERLLLFSLSHDAPDLEQSMKQLSACGSETIGCLSGPLPIKSDWPFFSCSIAIFERNACVSFSSLETGEGPVQVGRWHTYNKKQTSDGFDGLSWQGLDGEVNWDEIWNAKSSERFLPQELKKVRDAQTLIYFSDNSSWDLAMALHGHLPQAHHLGIMASATPFVTGQPFTLLRNGKIQSSGAVGVALRATPSKTVLSFDGVVQLTQPLIIRRVEGNLIHELEDSLPARILLKAIQDHGLPDELAKDVDYYIGVRGRHETPPRLLRIVAGSPSRGSIAVDEVPAPPVGTHIEFYYRPKLTSVRLPAGVLRQSVHESDAVIGAVVDSPENNHSSFLSSRQSVESESLTSQTYNSSFLVSSDQGFVLSVDALSPWKCTVPSAFGGLRFPRVKGRRVSSEKSV